MIEICFEPIITTHCPDIRVGVVSAHVANSATGDELWAEVEAEASRLKQAYSLPEVNRRPAIAATRRLYKALGKDPGRYRVASEQLCRRILRGLGLYRLTTLVDLVNLVSIASGYPISGLDRDRIAGNKLVMGVGRAGEHYEGIGRGPLNIEGMPVYRDAAGPVATPTSDEERTKFTPETSNVLICINAFGEEMPLEQAVDQTALLLKRYARATGIDRCIVASIGT